MVYTEKPGYKYISDAFDGHRAKLLREPYADPEDPDEYLAANIFSVPKEARWSYLQSRAKDLAIGELRKLQAEAARLDEAIWMNLEALGYGR